MKMRLFSMICLLVSLSSCNNWLDVELPDKVDEEKLFSKPEGFTEALAGIYSDMSKSSLYGKVLTMEYIDLYAQYYGYNSVATQYEPYRAYDHENDVSKNTHAAIWNKLYFCIASANNIIEWADKNANVLTTEQRDQIRGEAVALRAFLHFDLYRLFCPDVKRNPKDKGIPYNKKFGVSTPPMYTVEEVVQLIIDDFKEAERLLAADLITGITPYTMKDKSEADKYVARINLYGVKAMLARAYQARGENGKAIQYAEEVIDSKKFSLLNFTSVDQSEKETDVLFSDEHIFSLRNKDLADISKGLHKPVVTETSTTFAKLPFGSTYTIYESNNNDLRYIKWFSVGEFMKYTMNNQAIFFPKMPMIKLSEMYLIIAECSFAKEPEKSLEAINTLRDHRIRNNAHWSYLTRDYILQEMSREYLGEGQLWYAYKRNNLKIPTGSINGDVEPSNSVFVFPMPMKEIETGNRNMN